MKSQLDKSIFSGVFAALIGVCSWIIIPLPFTLVPINLALAAVLLAGVLLGNKHGTLAVTLYILLGAVGVPVFSGGTAGIGVLMGPTGGFIIGYLFAAFISGSLFSIKDKSPMSFIKLFLAVLSCYCFGIGWFMISTHASLLAGLTSCVLPFIPGDCVKIILAILLSKKIKPLLSKQLS